MSSSKFNTSSQLRATAGNASPLRAKLIAALDVYDKENAVGPGGTLPKFQTPRAFNRHSLPGSMSNYANQSPFHAKNGSATGSKRPLSIRGRLSDSGALLKLGAGGLSNAFQWKPTEKRSASVAEMDEPSSPPKRPRHDDRKNPFVFVQNLKLLHEDNVLARQMFLDLVEAQDKRAVYGGHNPKEIYTMGAYIDPKELSDKRDTSFLDAHCSSAVDKSKADYPVILESEGDSIFGTWFHELLNHGEEKKQQKVDKRSSQKSGDRQTTIKGDLPREGNRGDAVEVPAGCETNGGEESPTTSLPPMEAATDGSPLDANWDHSPPSPPHGSDSSPKACPIPPMAQVLPEVVLDASHLHTMMTTKPDGKKRGRKPKSVQAGSSGVVGSGVAGPSTSTSTGPFSYSDTRAQEIWEVACLKDYLGAHALFDSSEQSILIEGKRKVQAYLEKHSKLKKRLEDSPEGTARECLHLCGASAIWERIGKPEDLAAGETPKYQLTYKPCKDRAYATIDNYKKHVYRYHLHKHYKPYPKKEGAEDEGNGDEKQESTKGNGKAPQKRRKCKAVKKEDEDYEEEE